MMDLSSMTFIGLVTVGVVNVVTFFKPNLDSKVKFAIALVAAFVLTFVPADLGVLILDKLKIAIEVALASSGAYKLAMKVGGQ